MKKNNSSRYLHSFVISPTGKWTFICSNLNLFMTFFAKFVWNWHSSSWKEDYQMSSIYFSYFLFFSPFGKGPDPKFKQTWTWITFKGDKWRPDKQTDERRTTDNQKRPLGALSSNELIITTKFQSNKSLLIANLEQ